MAALLAMLAQSPARAVEVVLDGAAAGPLQPGASTMLRMRLSDQATGAPARGYHPRAWLRVPLRPGESCPDVTGRLARFGAGPRQAIAMDGVRLLVPAEDGSLATVDPRLNLATANLVRVDRLGDVPPAALALDAARALLWASYPAAREVRGLDLATGALLARWPLAGGPGELLAMPGQDGAVALGLDAAGAVARLAAEAAPVVGSRIGRGPILLAAGAERLLALGTGDGRLAVLDPWTLDIQASLALGAPAAALALVDGQDLALVATGRDLATIDLGRTGSRARATGIARTSLGIEADRLAVSPDGRWALALDRSRSVLAVVDLARGARLAHALAFEEGAEELLVARDALYVRMRDAPAVALVPLGALETKELVAERILMGATPTGGAGRRLLAPTDGEVGFWLAHPTDRQAYLFTGGAMRAATTSVPLKAGTPAGLVLAPRTPQPLGGGLYGATIQAPRLPGRYLLAVAIDQVAEARCLEVQVGFGDVGNLAAGLDAPPLLQAQLEGGGPIAGRETVILYSAADGRELAGRPLTVRAFAQNGGVWQSRTVAEPIGSGRWSARLRFPRAGRYIVLTEAPAAGLRYEDGPQLLVDVAAAGETAP